MDASQARYQRKDVSTALKKTELGYVDQVTTLALTIALTIALTLALTLALTIELTLALATSTRT